MLHPLDGGESAEEGVRQMDWFLQAVAEHMRGEYQFFVEAPAIAIFLVVMTGVAMWLFLGYLHGHTVSGLKATIGSKDATIETLREQHRTANAQFVAAAREKDSLVQKLGEAATFDGAALAREVQNLRSELEGRRLREWSPLSKEQLTQLESRLKRTGREEPAARTVSIICDDRFPDAIVLGEQIIGAFVHAGWRQSAAPDPERLWQETQRGIVVYAPKGQRISAFLTAALSDVFGEGLVRHQEVPSLFKGFLDEAAVVQVEIGRKPYV